MINQHPDANKWEYIMQSGDKHEYNYQEPEPLTWKEIEQIAFKGMLMFYGLAFLAMAPLLFVFIIKSVW
jgi:hypothetical protein